MQTDELSQISAQRIQYLFANIAKSITSSIVGSQTINAIMQQVELFFHPDNWSLLLVDATKQELYFAIAKGMDAQLLKDIRLKIGEGIAGHVAKSGQSIYVPNVELDTHFSQKIDYLSGFKTQSIIAVPIIYQKEVLGVIELINTLSNEHFSKEEIDILEIIADFSAIALANANAYERILYFAISDPLTGLYNRKQLDKLLEISQKPVIDNNIEEPRIIATWIDIDLFKQVNDQFGHATGDDVLAKTAKLLQSCCRENDFAFRVGGDEFLIVTMDLSKSTLHDVKNHLQQKLQTLSSQISPAHGFSFGMATGKISELRQLIIEADNLMYQDKHHPSADDDPV